MSELKNKTIKGVAWSAAERLATSTVGFAFGLLLARLLAPEDYGIIAMLNIFMAVSQAFIDSGFSSALIRKTDRSDNDTTTVFYFNILISVLCYAILFACAPLIASFYNMPILTSMTRIVGINLVIGSLAAVQQTLMSARLDFKTQAKVSLVSTVISGIVGVVMAYLGYGVWSLVAQGLASSVCRVAMLWIMASWRPVGRFSRTSFRELFGFGSKLLASGLLDTIYNNSYTIIIGKVFSASTLGYYSRASHLAQFPSVTTTGILQRVTYPVLSTIQHEDDRLAHNYRRILRISAYIVFPLMMGLVALADPLIRFLLTDKWAASIPLLQIVCFSMMWYPIHAINLSLLQVKGRSDLFLRLEIIKKVIGVTNLVITVPIGIEALCYGSVFTSIICLIINTYYTGRLIHVGFIRQMMDLLPILANSLIMLAIAYFAQLPFASHPLSLLIGTTAGCAYYFLSGYLLKSPELTELLNIIRRR